MSNRIGIKGALVILMVGTAVLCWPHGPMPVVPPVYVIGFLLFGVVNVLLNVHWTVRTGAVAATMATLIWPYAFPFMVMFVFLVWPFWLILMWTATHPPPPPDVPEDDLEHAPITYA